MTDVIQSVLDDTNRRGVASINAGQIDPNGPIGQAILVQSQQRDQRTLDGPPNSLWTSGKGPDSFANADARAFQRAGDEFGRGNYAAGIGNALTGAAAAVPAAIYDGGVSALRGIGAPLAAAHSAIGAGTQAIAPQVSEFARGLTGGTPSPTNADVVMAAIKSTPQGATPVQGQPQGATPVQGQPQGQPQSQQVAQQKGVLSDDFLKSLPKMQSDAIKSMGGISHRDLLALLHGNMEMQLRQNDPVWQGKTAFNSGMAGKAMMEAGGVHLDANTGAVTFRSGFPEQDKAAAAEEIRRHQAHIEMGRPHVYPMTTILPNTGQGG